MPMVADRIDPHPFLANAVDNRRLARLDGDGRAVIDGQVDSFLVAQPHQRIAGDAAFAGPAGWVIDPAKRQHLRAVFRGDDEPDTSPLARTTAPSL